MNPEFHVPTPRRRPGGPSVRPVLALLWLLALAVPARALEVVRVRYWTAPDHTRVVLDLDGPADYAVRRVAHPERIAVNVPGAVFRVTDTVPVNDGVVKRLRRNQGRRRAQLVIDLAAAARFRHFRLPARDGRPERIVVDVFRPGGEKEAAAPSPPAAAADEPPVTVVVDAGHGGLDPGAVRHGVREKDVTLAIAREVARLLDRHPGVRAVLTRKGDYFVSLAERVRIARRSGGDLFVSIHTNTHRRSAVSGMEVYFLSQKRATDQEARDLADRENAADLVGLPPEASPEDDVLSILMDLRAASVLLQSQDLAEAVLGAARRDPELKARRVKQAGFQVLRSLAMPSILVETAYLTNSADRRLLSRRQGQRRIARVLVEGILSYLGRQRPELATGTPAWTTRYRVQAGDSLWELARRHGTTIRAIKEHNRLRGDRLQRGQVLLLP